MGHKMVMEECNYDEESIFQAAKKLLNQSKTV